MANKKASTRKVFKRAPSNPAPLHDGAPLVSKAVRIDAAALDNVLAQLLMTEDNKRRVRAYLVDGHSMRAIADAGGVSPELVSASVRRVRIKMQTLLNPWAFVTVPLTLPLALAEELRGLSDLLAKLDDADTAQAILKDVQRAVTIAKTKVLDAD